MGSDVTALKLVYSITKSLIRGSILTAWKTKQWHKPDSSSPLVILPLWCWPSWRKSNVRCRQSMSTGRQSGQARSNPSSPRTGTSATDTDPWPCRLTAWETKPWTSEPTSSHLTFALWLSLKRSGARSELPCLRLLVSAASMARTQMQTIIWTHTTHWRQQWGWTTETLPHRALPCLPDPVD